MTHPDFDLSVERLREIGGLKWSMHPDALGAFVAEMDFGVAAPVADALRAAVDDGLVGYQTTPLLERMSLAWSGWAERRWGWRVAPERVRPLADVMAALLATLEHFTPAGAPLIVPTPAYMPFLETVPLWGRRVLEVPLVVERGRHVLDLDALQAAYDAGGHLLVVCNPHNPTGRVLEPEEMLAVAEVVERNGGRVFADEIHAPLVYDGRTHVPYASLDETTARHTVTATSASKAWNLPGLKCAQLVLSNPDDARRWSAVGLPVEHGASTLGIVAAVAAYEQGDRWLGEVLQHLDGTRHLLCDLLAEQLPEVGYRVPDGTYLAWLDCRALGLGDRPAQHFLERAGVALTDGTRCGAGGAGFARLTFATPRPVLRQIVARMAASLPDR